MKAIVNEPQIEYKVSTWKNRGTSLQVDNIILRLEVDNIYVTGEAILKTLPIGVKKKAKISSLRGRIKKLSEQEIDHKLSDLRNEWERDF